MIEIVDTRSGQFLHLSQFLGRTLCSASYDKSDPNSCVAHPALPKSAWKDAGKPICRRCEHNYRLIAEREDEMLAAYGMYVR